jgi:DNA-binding protein HU-beta
VIKLDIINNVADKTGVPKMKAEIAVEALFEAMKDAMKRGERIELRGFGVFVVKPRKRGIGRNPRTGTQVAIPEGKTIRFKNCNPKVSFGFLFKLLAPPSHFHLLDLSAAPNFGGRRFVYALDQFATGCTEKLTPHTHLQPVYQQKRRGKFMAFRA